MTARPGVRVASASWKCPAPMRPRPSKASTVMTWAAVRSRSTKRRTSRAAVAAAAGTVAAAVVVVAAGNNGMNPRLPHELVAAPPGSDADHRQKVQRAAQERAAERDRELESQASSIKDPRERIEIWERLHAL